MNENELESLLYMTRKYPPQTGGMENMSYHLSAGLRQRTRRMKLVALGKKQSHLLWFFPWCSLYAALFSRQYKTLLLGDGLMCFHGVVSKLFAPRTKRVIAIAGLDILYPHPLYQLYLKLFLKHSADLFICISRETELALRRKQIQNTVVILDGVDPLRFDMASEQERATFRTEKGFSENCLTLVTTGRLVKRKGVAWFVERVMPQLKGLDIAYLIVGEGKERPEIERAIEENGLQEQVRMLGRVSEEELKRIYGAADLFIMPNIQVPGDMEGFGLVALEASLAGLTVLASGIEGIRDAVQDGKNGILLNSGDAEEWRGKILEAYRDRERFRELGRSFRAYTETHCTWDITCDQYAAAIRALEEGQDMSAIQRKEKES